MKIALPTGGNLVVADGVFATMSKFVQGGVKDLEACGMLIGHHPQGSETIILDRLTLPQPEDHRTHIRCQRSQAAHQNLLNIEWTLSGEKRTYVGEWHTHPEAIPTPSPLDRRSWVNAMRETAFHGPGLVFIIVGTQVTRLWFKRRDSKSSVKIAELQTYRTA